MIETERLIIREITDDDWRKMQAIARDFRESDYVIYDMPLPVDDEEIQALTKKFADTHLFFGVFLREGGDMEMIGYVCFHEAGDRYDLGYCFHSGYQGKGYALESCSALMQELEVRRGIKRFTAGTALKNTPSCRLLNKLGFTLTGTERLSFCRDDAGKNIEFEGGIFSK